MIFVYHYVPQITIIALRHTEHTVWFKMLKLEHLFRGNDTKNTQIRTLLIFRWRPCLEYFSLPSLVARCQLRATACDMKFTFVSWWWNYWNINKSTSNVRGLQFLTDNEEQTSKCYKKYLFFINSYQARSK